GHEDHIGAIPYLLQNVNVPIYATRLTNALIENKLKEHKKIKAKLISVKPKQVIKLGVFTIEII
ncbi:MAG TPA: ribonuclease J, partial [Clostridiales bacterium]|nr:ribonuclease J [Clostridiales bacterium]